MTSARYAAPPGLGLVHDEEASQSERRSMPFIQTKTKVAIAMLVLAVVAVATWIASRKTLSTSTLTSARAPEATGEFGLGDIAGALEDKNTQKVIANAVDSVKKNPKLVEDAVKMGEKHPKLAKGIAEAALAKHAGVSKRAIESAVGEIAKNPSAALSAAEKHPNAALSAAEQLTEKKNDKVVIRGKAAEGLVENALDSDQTEDSGKFF